MAIPVASSPRSLLPACLFLLICVSPLIPSQAQEPSPSPTPPPRPPSFSFRWLDNKGTFQAGDTATIMIKSRNLPPSGEIQTSSLYFAVSVNDIEGNSTFITDVAVHLDGDPSAWNITFVPLRTGYFAALVTENPEDKKRGGHVLPFTVTGGGVYPSTSMVSWMFEDDEHVAGTRTHVAIVPKDAFGNAIARNTEMPLNGFFSLSGSYVNGTAVDFLDFHYNGWIDDERISFDFGYTVAGDFLVHIRGNNTDLRHSPLLLTVKPGPMDVSKCTCSWKHGTNYFQALSKLELFIYQRDTFGNLVPEIRPFDARVIDNTTRLYVPVADLSIEAVADGVQRLSFVTAVPPGVYEITISDPKLNQKVSDYVYVFHVFKGYCDGSKSVANGSGIAHSVAGSTSSFMVFLMDNYGSPAPIETEVLRVKILRKSGTAYADPLVVPISGPNGMIPTEGPSSFNIGPATHQEIVAGNATVQPSQFNVSYTPQIVGDYEVWVLCGNIVLNGGNPYNMTVLPGAINASLSSVLMFDPWVKRSVQNPVTIRLVDSFMNPVASLESKLKFELKSTNFASPGNTTSFVPGDFVDNRDGSYTAHYVASELGSCGMCVQYEDQQLSPCPFEVQILEDKYFPDIKNVSVSVWEDESVSFDVLSNVYIEGSIPKVDNSSSPLHGSVLQFSQIFRYTPFEGFFGNDSFSYTISDENNNVATGTVFISVRCKPPQFKSLPKKLHVTEDIMSPKFNGFPGIKLVYSDITENISVTVKAVSGMVFLASTMPKKLRQPSELSTSRGGGEAKELILEGTVGAVNYALQFIQYIGNEDFYGNDVILLHTMNRNGIEDAQFPIIVDPINDPPVILAPKSIFLGGNQSREGYKIFDNNRDDFKFSIVEPDLRNYPGNKSDFLLVFSLEVFEGTLKTTLPAGIIPTVQVKTEGTDDWLPLQTYVAIANHFDVRGRGIKFVGNVQDCNNATQNLFYNGPSNKTTLTITVDDLGNYGCYPDCEKMMSASLSATTTIHLVKTKPMKLGTPLWVTTVLAIQILIMLCLGGVILFCTCLMKCMKVLKDERRNGIDDETRRPEQTPRRQQMGSSESQSEDAGVSVTVTPAPVPAPVAGLPLQARTLSFRHRSRSGKQELELQPVSGTRNSENHADQCDKDK